MCESKKAYEKKKAIETKEAKIPSCKNCGHSIGDECGEDCVDYAMWIPRDMKKPARVIPEKHDTYELCKYCHVPTMYINEGWKVKCEECRDEDMTRSVCDMGHPKNYFPNPNILENLPSVKTIGQHSYCKFCKITYGSKKCSKCSVKMGFSLPTEFVDRMFNDFTESLDDGFASEATWEDKQSELRKQKSTIPEKKFCLECQSYGEVICADCNQYTNSVPTFFRQNEINKLDSMSLTDVLEEVKNLSNTINELQSSEEFWKKLYTAEAEKYSELLENVNTMDKKVRELAMFASDILVSEIGKADFSKIEKLMKVNLND
jgi:hypothetical protein